MNTSSAKAKGQRAAKEVKELLHKFSPDLETDDIIVTPSGVPGEDLRLSPKARKKFPFAIEIKNQETAKIWAWMKQAQSHRQKDYTPLVIFKRNRETLKVCLELEDFLKLLS